MSRVPVRLSLSVASVAALSAAALLLGGCGTGASVSGPHDVTMAAIQGIVHGGPNPITGASVTLYETQTTGTSGFSGTSAYGSAGKILAGPVLTNASGGFSFTTGYTCNSTEFAYVAVTGGTTGSFAANNNAVLMAAIGSCSNLSTATAQGNTTIFINELSTIAAAYALSNFMNVTGTAGAQVVNVGAPVANQAATGSCAPVSPSTTTTACVAAGLAHAFANANNLVNAVGFSGAIPTGQARTVTTTNTASSVPQAQLDTLANVLQACVNSAGGGVTSGASDGTACGNLFYEATPPGTTNYPTDTLTAAINMNKNPTNNAATIYGLGSPTAYFQPSLAAAPPDLSVVIVYSGATAFPAPVALALDANDNVFVATADAATPTTSGVAGIKADGTPLFSYTANASTTYKGPKYLATDTLGNAYLTNAIAGSSTSATNVIRPITTSTGMAGTVLSTTTATPAYPAPIGVAVDRYNNLWYSTSNTTTSTVNEILEGATATTFTSTGATAGPLSQVQIDGNENVYSTFAGTSTVAAHLYGVPNTATSGTATYSAALLDSGAYTSLGTNNNFLYMTNEGFDYANKVYTVTQRTLDIDTPTKNGSNVVTGLTTFTQTANVGTFYNQPGSSTVDGGQLNWIAIVSATGKVEYQNTTTSPYTAYSIDPCYPVVSNSAYYCSDNAQITTNGGTIFYLGQYTSTLALDSAGSVWATAGANAAATNTKGVVYQVIGTGTPTWPQLSWGHPGVCPGSTATNGVGCK